MAYNSHAGLLTTVANWIHRSDLASEIEDFIDLTEDMIKREPQPPESREIGGVRGNLTEATGTLSAVTLGLPADYLEAVKLSITVGGKDYPLKFVENKQRDNLHKSGSGQPRSYSIADQIYFDVTPDSSYAYKLLYWPEFPALVTSTNETNWITDNYPDVYLAGCMYWANRYIQNEKETLNWLSQYKAAAWSASNTYREGRYQQGSIAIQVA